MGGKPTARIIKKKEKAFHDAFRRERQVVTRFELPEQALERVRELLRRERLKADNHMP